MPLVAEALHPILAAGARKNQVDFVMQRSGRMWTA